MASLNLSQKNFPKSFTKRGDFKNFKLPNMFSIVTNVIHNVYRYSKIFKDFYDFFS